jgi:hypothetical protein
MLKTKLIKRLLTSRITIHKIKGLKSNPPIGGTTWRIGESIGSTIRSSVRLMGWKGSIKKDRIT